MEYSVDGKFLLNLQTSCRDDELLEEGPFVSSEMRSAWNELQQTTRFTCSMLLTPDDDDNESTSLLDDESALFFPRVQLDPCGDDNLFAFSNMTHYYILALSTCHYQVEFFQKQVFLPISVPSYRFSWQTAAIATLVIDMDLSEAKSIFMDYYTAEHAGKGEEQQKEQDGQDTKKAVEDGLSNEQLVTSPSVQQQPPNLPSLLTCPRRQQQSSGRDSILAGLEEMVESELNDMNRILTLMAGIGLLLLLSILWTLLQMMRRPKRKVSLSGTSVNAVSLQPLRPVMNISPLSLDPILADANKEEEEIFSTPPQEEEEQLSPCSKLAKEWSRSKSLRRSHRKSEERRRILSPTNNSPETLRFLPKMAPVEDPQDENRVPGEKFGTPGLASPEQLSPGSFVRSYWC